jgi:hypothetical protein
VRLFRPRLALESPKLTIHDPQIVTRAPHSAPSGSATSRLTPALTPPPLSTGLTTEVVPVVRATSPSSQPPSVPATPLSLTSDDRPTAPLSTSSSPTSTRTRKTLTFRHVPARAARTPIVPSTSSLGKDSLTTSLPSRTLDPNKPHRPHSRLSTVTFPSDPSQAPAMYKSLRPHACLSNNSAHSTPS